METMIYRSIDMAATGRKIAELRRRHGYSVADLQAYFGFTAPQAIYKWQTGKSLPSTDNLYALSWLFRIPMEEILVPLPLPSISEKNHAGGSDSVQDQMLPPASAA